MSLTKIRSTYQNDYYEKEMNVNKLPTPPKIIDPIKKRKPIVRTSYNLETLSPYPQQVYIPMSFGFRPKQCVHTNPMNKIQVTKLADEMFLEKLKVRKTRIRTLMFPQVPIDDVPEEEMYGENGLVNYIYGSNWSKWSKYTAEAAYPKKPPKEGETKYGFDDADVLDPTNLVDPNEKKIICRSTNGIEPIDPALKKYHRIWDRGQRKVYADQFSLFWEKHPNNALCSLCDPMPAPLTLSQEEKNRLRKLIKDKSLCNSYTLYPTDYTGYIPLNPYGVTLQQRVFEKCDPYITNLMQDHKQYIPCKPRKLGSKMEARVPGNKDI